MKTGKKYPKWNLISSVESMLRMRPTLAKKKSTPEWVATKNKSELNNNKLLIINLIKKSNEKIKLFLDVRCRHHDDGIM